jgi:hypothetical protein
LTFSEETAGLHLHHSTSKHQMRDRSVSPVAVIEKQKRRSTLTHLKQNSFPQKGVA